MNAIPSKKKIVFYDSDKNQADLKIRLKYDGLKQSEFFRAIVAGYLQKDENILNFIYKYKEENQTQARVKRQKSRSLIVRGKEIEKQFGLNNRELENIFDIIEDDNPDL